MTALTKSMKDDLMGRAVKQAFKAQSEALEVSKQLLAEEVYVDQRGLLGFAEMMSTPHAKQWLSFTRSVRLFGPVSRDIKATLSKDLPLFSCERYNATIDLRLEEGSKFLPALKYLQLQESELRRDTDKLRQDVAVLLAPIKTFAQFRLIWPEGVSLLPAEPGKVYALVDAGLVLSVNALVGLPPKVAA